MDLSAALQRHMRIAHICIVGQCRKDRVCFVEVVVCCSRVRANQVVAVVLIDQTGEHIFARQLVVATADESCSSP